MRQGIVKSSVLACGVAFAVALVLLACLLAAPSRFAACVLQANAASTDNLIGIELYAASTSASGEWVKKLDRVNKGTKTAPEWWLKGGIKEKGGQIRMLLEAYWDDGVAFWQYEEAWRKLDVKYTSSDKSVATVSSTGIVTACGDGDVTITAMAQDKAGNEETATLSIKVSGQKGALVEEVYVCDAEGHQYEDERITYKKADLKLELYVRLVLDDGTKVSNAPQAKDCDEDALEKLTSLSWSVSDSEVASVNASTGVVRGKGLGTTKVYATATGADPENKLAGKVRSYVWVVIDDGEYGRADKLPANDLTVEVVYDKYPDKVVWTKKYTLDEVQKLADPVKSTYTFTREGGKYVTASGIGIYLTTLIDLTPIKLEQVASFKFTANDGANPGKMSYDYLFNKCYYWPNYEFGGDTSGGKLVFPMLAWASDWRDSSTGMSESGENYSDLGDQTRLRLLFGSKTKSDGRTDHSLKYISKMTVRIKGAPDTTDGEEETGGEGTQVDKGAKSGDNKVVAGSGTGGSKKGSKEGTAASAASTGAKGGKAAAAPRGGAKGKQALKNPSSATSQRPQESGQTAQVAAKGDGSSAEAGSSAQRWKVYQMLNTLDDAKLAIEELDDNPLAPFAIPFVLLLLFGGGLQQGLRFRRQLR